MRERFLKSEIISGRSFRRSRRKLKNKIVKTALTPESGDHGQWGDFNWYISLGFIAVGLKVKFEQANPKIIQKHVKRRAMKTC